MHWHGKPIPGTRIPNAVGIDDPRFYPDAGEPASVEASDGLGRRGGAQARRRYPFYIYHCT